MAETQMDEARRRGREQGKKDAESQIAALTKDRDEERERTNRLLEALEETKDCPNSSSVWRVANAAMERVRLSRENDDG